MISFYKSRNGVVEQVEGLEKGCWVNVLEPTSEDRQWLLDTLGIVPEFIKDALDDEETSHVDVDEDTGQTLVIVDCPFPEDENEAVDSSVKQYDTHPLAFIFLQEKDCLVTLSLRPNDILDDFAEGKHRDVHTGRYTQFLLKVLLRIVQRYVSCLRSINRQIREYESTLRRTMQNSELMKMLGLEKSLVYFSTSLQGLEDTGARVRHGRAIPLYDDDRDLIDDVRIEIAQASEMCSIYTSILEGVMDTFSSVISNNLNHTMKTLTIITLILSIPTIIFSFYGMNVEGLPLVQWAWVPVAVAAVLCAVATLILHFGKFLK